MNIFEYIEEKINEYESIKNENQLQLKKNKNIIQKLSSQVEQITNENNPGQVFVPKSIEDYDMEVKELQMKIALLEQKNEELKNIIENAEAELSVLDNLELPEQIVDEPVLTKKDIYEITTDYLTENVSRETFQNTGDFFVQDIEKFNGEVKSIISIDLLKEKLRFCLHIAELDSHRCRIELENIIEKLENENVSRETFSET